MSGNVRLAWNKVLAECPSRTHKIHTSKAMENTCMGHFSQLRCSSEAGHALLIGIAAGVVRRREELLILCHHPARVWKNKSYNPPVSESWLVESMKSNQRQSTTKMEHGQESKSVMALLHSANNPSQHLSGSMLTLYCCPCFVFYLSYCLMYRLMWCPGKNKGKSGRVFSKDS